MDLNTMHRILSSVLQNTVSYLCYIHVYYELQLGLCPVTVLHKNEQYVNSDT
jgi:hypothetical protein